MPASLDAPGARVLTLWQRLSPLPGGRWLFNRVLGWRVPYTGALGAQVVELAPGHAVCVLRERRGVRNHLRSIHAVALANLAELCSGTAMLTALPPGTRGIVTRLEIDFVRKGRGRLTARTDVQLPALHQATQLFPEAIISDASGAVVARARITWNVEPSAEALGADHTRESAPSPPPNEGNAIPASAPRPKSTSSTRVPR
ncbi:MAG: hotdog fold domain-containing protein [Gemmatimonadota bacterium]